MKAAQRTLALGLGLALLFGLIAGCNGLIGADAPTLVDSLAGAGGSSGGGGAEAGPNCVLASDCPDAQICLFRLCSKQCAADKDCQFGRCLQTTSGNACVVPASATCQSDDNCPAGSQCKGNVCRSTCTVNSECLSDQTCVSGACVGTDVFHDPASGGSGAGGTSNGGGAGEAGASDSTGGASPGGAGGTGGGAGSGMAGSGGMSDGTATGTLGAACDKNGATACAGHAQRSQLICQGGKWQPNGTCAGSTLCDTTLGGNAGSCQPIIAECAGKTAGLRFCRGTETDLRECGTDLVTATVVQSCTFVCSAGACTGDCHPMAKQCKAGGVIPQTCLDNGTWKDETACAYLCDGATGKCIAAGCKDNVKNGDETDTDCGGSCGGCPIAGACKLDGDCIAPASGHCLSNKCVAAACGDGVKNGSETDVDCGGTCAKDCAVNQGCAGDQDCVLPASGHCSGLKCAAASCADNVTNGSETDKDCGGSCPSACGIGAGCGQDADCAVACVNNKCAVCKPTTKQCVSTSYQTCSGTGTWGASVACAVTNGAPSCSGNGVCGIASCNSGYGNCDNMVSNGCEVSLNVAMACGTTCSGRVACSSNNGTPSCPNGACVMACTGGYGDCNSAGGVNDGCEKQLNSVTSCGTCASTTSCNAPANKCSAGSCVANTPYNVGDAAANTTTFDPANNKWYLVRISAQSTATVTGFRVFGSQSGSGIARMALWTDDGAGHPDKFLAQSSNGSFPVAAGFNTDTATPGGVQIAGGKNYWVGAVFSGGAHIYYRAVPGSTVYTTDLSFGSAPATSLATFPTASAGQLTDLTLSLFILVQDVPP